MIVLHELIAPKGAIGQSHTRLDGIISHSGNYAKLEKVLIVHIFIEQHLGQPVTQGSEDFSHG